MDYQRLSPRYNNIMPIIGLWLHAIIWKFDYEFIPSHVFVSISVTFSAIDLQRDSIKPYQDACPRLLMEKNSIGMKSWTVS